MDVLEQARRQALEARVRVLEATIDRQSTLILEMQAEIRLQFSATAHRLEDIADTLDKLKERVG